MRVTIALVAGMALFALVLVFVLSGSPREVISTNSVVAANTFVETTASARACQDGETLPRGASAIRLSLYSIAGPSVSVRALSGSRVLTGGEVGSGWTGGSVSVPVHAVSATAANVKVCFSLGAVTEKVAIVGSNAAPGRSAVAADGTPLGGRLKVEYLRSATGSWWSHATNVARRIGLGRAPTGGWVALLPIALMGLALTGASWLVLRELR